MLSAAQENSPMSVVHALDRVLVRNLIFISVGTSLRRSKIYFQFSLYNRRFMSQAPVSGFTRSPRRAPCVAHKALVMQAILSFSISLVVCSPNFQPIRSTGKIRIVMDSMEFLRTFLIRRFAEKPSQNVGCFQALLSFANSWQGVRNNVWRHYAVPKQSLPSRDRPPFYRGLCTLLLTNSARVL